MKRAKIMLAAIAVLAVVGGSFALKARTNNLFYQTNAAGDCISTTFPLRTTVPQQGQPGLVQTTYFTTTVLGACPATRIYTVN